MYSVPLTVSCAVPGEDWMLCYLSTRMVLKTEYSVM